MAITTFTSSFEPLRGATYRSQLEQDRRNREMRKTLGEMGLLVDPPPPPKPKEPELDRRLLLCG